MSLNHQDHEIDHPERELPHALRVIEFGRVLDQLASHCETEPGARLAWAETPRWDYEAVVALQTETSEAYTLLGRLSMPSLSGISDVQNPCRRAARGGTLDGTSLYRIGATLSTMRQVKAACTSSGEALPNLMPILLRMPEDVRLESKLMDSLDGDGEVRDSASQELQRLRQTKRTTAARVLERIQSYATGKTRDLLSDPIFTTREGRYVVPLKAENRGKLKGIVHDTSASGQTLFVEPQDVVELGNALREAEAAERAEVARILQSLSDWVGKIGDQIAAGVLAAGELDLILARARLGYAQHGCLLRLTGGNRIEITSGRHPLIEPEKVVPISIDVGSHADGLLITGPNTGGKTVAIKLVGLFVAMAQCGMMLPADRVELGPFRRIWADIGDEQSLQQSLSTFSAHVKNIATALQSLDEGHLVLLDEVGAGTDPAEGSALAKAILLAIQAARAKVLASTHYGELKVFAYQNEGFENASMEFDVKTLRPTYKLLMGSPGASHALKIAQRYGMPDSVIQAAENAAGSTQRDVSAMLERLEQAEKRARKAQSESDRLTSKLRQVEAETDKKLREADENRRSARKRAAEELEEALRKLRLEAQTIFDEIKANPTQQGIQLARERLKKLQAEGTEQVAELRPQETRAPNPVPTVQKGDKVRVSGYNMGGIVLEPPRDGQAYVQIGSIKMRFALDQLEVDTAKSIVSHPVHKPAAKKSLGLQKLQSSSAEIVLIQMRAEVAGEALDRFLDDSILAGMPSVRIVHGKGEGILRSLTHDRLKRHRGVSSFREGEPGEGGSGVTIAYFT
ncbi:MAG: endonuclease MutS2 [Armatimonadetes bacterium]|nr:endonuclease MutS2 [Armatimonadota bacterium]